MKKKKKQLMKIQNSNEVRMQNGAGGGGDKKEVYPHHPFRIPRVNLEDKKRSCRIWASGNSR